jgi:hypothetical protein
VNAKFFKLMNYIVILLAIVIGLWICIYAFGRELSNIFGGYYIELTNMILTKAIAYITIVLVILTVIFVIYKRRSK